MQNNFQNDSAMPTPKDKYCTIGDDSFKVNSPCIMTTDQTLTKGQPYLLISGISSDGLYHSVVRFIDCSFSDVLNIIVKDVHAELLMKIQIDFNVPKSKCTWMLVDASNLQSIVDHLSVYDYCISNKG